MKRQLDLLRAAGLGRQYHPPGLPVGPNGPLDVNQSGNGINIRLCVPLLIIALCSALCIGAAAQNFKTLYSFSAAKADLMGSVTNIDGAKPSAGLVLAGITLYGTTYWGSTYGRGSIFKINTDGTGFTSLNEFAFYGAYPVGGLIASNSLLYGTTSWGGEIGAGVIFAFEPNGLRELHSFSGIREGGTPLGGLVLSGDTLYGTTAYGGGFVDGWFLDNGTVFAINTNGSGFSTLHSFNVGEGSRPQGGLILEGNTLYGTTFQGGSLGSGTIFKLNTDGTGFATLHRFTPINSVFLTNSDGAYPLGGLVLSGDTLFGTAKSGGSRAGGTVYALNKDGTDFRVLHSFLGATSTNGDNDGAEPSSSLVLCEGVLYGTAQTGGSSKAGTVFSLKTDGGDFTILHSFSPYNNYTNEDGAIPNGLILAGNTLYGTTGGGGSGGAGTIFSISLPIAQPQLKITFIEANVVLSWPRNFANFTLETTSNLASSIWNTNFPVPVIVNGEYSATNLILGIQQFFRLSQ